MKRKIISVLFALVLAFTLIGVMPQATPVRATDGSLYGTLYLASGGTGGAATWSTDQQKYDDYSAALAGGTAGGTSYGQVWKPVNIPLADITAVSFWYYLSSTGQADYSAWPVYKQEGQTYTDDSGYLTPYVTLEISDGTTTHWIISQPFARDPDGDWTADWEQWQMTDNAAEYPVDSGMDPTEALWHDEAFANDDPLTGGSGAYPAGWEYLSFFQTTYSDYNVVKLKIAMGWWAFTTNQTAYADDITVTASSTTYAIEPRVFIGTTPYGAIDTAIGAASNDDTILVYDGTYNEDLAFEGKTGITLKSANGRDVTIIELAGLVKQGIVFKSGANDITIGGSEGHGFTINSAPEGSVGWFSIEVRNGNSGIKISYNIIDTTGQASQGISVGAAGATDLTVSNNIFIADEGDEYQDVPISLNGLVTSLTMTYNEFTGSGTPDKYGAAIDIDKGLSGGTISNNTIAGFDRGILTGSGGSSVGDLLISHNDISGCGKGIMLRGTGVDMNTVTVVYNDISGNTQYGLKNECTTGIVNATLNWWGDISGPEYGSYGASLPYGNPGGTGDKVSDNVDYEPWLTRDFQTALDDNIAYFGFAWAYLGKGWNTFSTPIALDSACNTWDKYKALGDTLNVLEGAVNAYWYDASASPPHFVAVDPDYELKPCDAIYVRMAASDIAAILYSPYTSVPAKGLYAGWNLVGLADWEHHATQEDIHYRRGTPVDVALATVYMVTGDKIGYSLVMSPPMNQNPWSFVRESEIRSEFTEPVDGYCYHRYDHMFPTNGYWVFMINNGTLAGFTFTPMSLK